MFNTQKKLFKKISVLHNEILKEGSLVKCDPEQCYISYTQFVKRHPKYMARFAYKCYPRQEHVYKILGVYNHIMEDFYDKNEYVVVVESTTNRQIFLMGECGLIPYMDAAGRVKQKLKETKN